MEINPTNKNIVRILQRIKEDDPNWKQSLKSGRYMPKAWQNGDDGFPIILLFILFILVLITQLWR